MIPKYSLTFQEVQQPIVEPVTKFGGQPVWLTEPQWPLGRFSGEPMQFIGQIALDARIFGNIEGKMAYLFMSDDPFVNNTFEPDGGENAVIIQPGSYDGEIEPLRNGPTLFRMDIDRNEIACEFAVELLLGEDPDEIVEDEGVHASPQAWEEFTKLWEENKIGGASVFIQGSELPGDGIWRLLLQLDSASVPFEINFGDAGVGYAFLSEDGRTGKFLWQCM